MSGAWSGGKGDKSRVTDYQSYWNSALWEHKGKTRKALFLDDCRIPSMAYLWNDNFIQVSSTQKDYQTVVDVSRIPEKSWDIVRSWEDFKEYIDKNGIPDVVSFDNDLVDFSNYELTAIEVQNLLKMEGWEDSSVKMGAHCAQYLVEKCKELNKPIPKYYIHTANRNAYFIIKGILEDAKL